MSCASFFAASDAGDDATLQIALPDGSWVCNDDGGGNLNPMVVFDDPLEGPYIIRVGSYKEGEYIPGALTITGLELEP